MARLSIALLGPLQVTVDGRSVVTLAYDKVWALLAYLAVNADRALSRSTLAGLLWPDQPEATARTNLRQALARLRQAIGDHGRNPPFLIAERETIQFNTASDQAVDLITFATTLATCQHHVHYQAESCAICATQRTTALSIYRGPLLDQFTLADSDLFEQWLTITREQFHQLAIGALADLTIYHERQGDYTQAIQQSRRQLALDPWREEAHRDLMRLFALNGQRSAALAQYQQCCAMLAAELGVAPAPETTRLYERLCAATEGEPPATAPLTLPATRLVNLPSQPTPFVGRATELAQVAALIADPSCRLITLHGPGGIGKTRLALQAATEQVDVFAHGVIFVPLAGVNCVDFLVPAIATALTLTLAGPSEPASQLLNYLGGKQLLLVLDNFEHLLEGTALISALLQQAPSVMVLVTSRERLGLSSEWLYSVMGLTLPQQPQLSALTTSGAGALFLQHARQSQNEFAPSADEVAAIVRICHLTEGLPLAIELAAVWVRALSCAEIALEIKQSLTFLITNQTDRAPRHRSLQVLFDHSWRLLTPEEQMAFAACTVFRGGFTREAAAQVAGAGLPILAALVDKSLLRHHQERRYTIHELIRQYGAAKLVDRGLLTAVRNRHLTYYATMAEEAEAHLRGSAQTRQWYERLAVEHNNLRAALERALADGGDFDAGLRMVGALWEFWMTRGFSQEGEQQAVRFLARPEAAAPTRDRARALHTAGALVYYQANYHSAASLLAECIAIARQLGPSAKFLLAQALIAQGYTFLRLGEHAANQPVWHESLRLGQELQDPWIMGHAQIQLGKVAQRQRNYGAARQAYQAAVDSFFAQGISVMVGSALSNLGALSCEEGDYGAATATLAQCLENFRQFGDRARIADTLCKLGYAAAGQQRFAEAAALFQEALTIQRDLNSNFEQAHTLDGWGRVARQQGPINRRKDCTAKVRAYL